jgi:putative redox protein
MGVLVEGSYLGKKRVRLIHGPSGTELLADAPRDNAGEGAFFSPTDLVAGALGACMMIIMGIVAERSGIDLAGMTMRVEKEMRSTPRRIGGLSLALHLPAGLTEEQRRKLEAAARTCPVHQSLHPDVSVGVEFLYDV